jgi:hypothetical protein
MSKHLGGISPYSGRMRQEDGITVFCENPEGDQRWSSRSDMSPRVALRDIAREIDSWDGEWRVIVVSSPTTIWTDIHGRRENATPEANLLSAIGRLDLCHPRIRGSSRRIST